MVLALGDWDSGNLAAQAEKVPQPPNQNQHFLSKRMFYLRISMKFNKI
jgi:hypothetical protein